MKKQTSAVSSYEVTEKGKGFTESDNLLAEIEERRRVVESAKTPGSMDPAILFRRPGGFKWLLGPQFPICQFCGIRHRPTVGSDPEPICPVYRGHKTHNTFQPNCRLCQLEKLDAEQWAKEQFEKGSDGLKG